MYGSLEFNSVQFKMVFMRSEKAHMRSIPSLRNFPNVAFETVPMLQGSLQYKRALISFHVVSCRASPYELLRLYSPSRSLRSASDTGIFRIPRMAGGSCGRGSFNTSDLCSGTLILSLSGIRLHSFLLNQN